nr:PREDICTED: uncharacterized protein LOC107983448 [Anolis carolinensis]|eukprot:XP_016852620.1 PREDICTED: uncharacterized protein LOC107983448 [Anolis carolinensis]
MAPSEEDTFEGFSSDDESMIEEGDGMDVNRGTKRVTQEQESDEERERKKLHDILTAPTEEESFLGFSGDDASGSDENVRGSSDWTRVQEMSDVFAEPTSGATFVEFSGQEDWQAADTPRAWGDLSLDRRWKSWRDDVGVGGTSCCYHRCYQHTRSESCCHTPSPASARVRRKEEKKRVVEEEALKHLPAAHFLLLPSLLASTPPALLLLV